MSTNSSEYMRKYREENRGRVRVISLNWYRRNRTAALEQKRGAKCHLVRRARNKIKAIGYLGGKCTDCGYNENPDGFEFDHIAPRNGGKTVSELLDRSWELLRIELDKCELVCGTCHNIRTARRRKECQPLPTRSRTASS